MSPAAVYTLILLLHLLSMAVFPAALEASPWFMGCFTDSIGPAAGEAGDLDPVECCARCLHQGYHVAALTSEVCYCGDWQHGLVAAECFSSSYRETKGVRGGGRQSVLSLPIGGQGRLALYRTEGPFLHSVHLSVSTDEVQAGKTFVVDISGKLAGGPEQPTGLIGVGVQEFSFVTVDLGASSPPGQSSHQVSVFDDGSFTRSFDWIFETPGKHDINISFSNLLSTLSSTLQISVIQPPPNSLVISLLHGPRGNPPTIFSLQADPNNLTREAVYQGDPVTLHAHLVHGQGAEFTWRFTNEENEKNMEVKMVCPPDCVNSTVNWTFEMEGLHVVSVNASGAFGWTQESIQVEVLCPNISNHRANESGDHLPSIGGISVCVSSYLRSRAEYVDGNRKTSSQLRVNPTWQPPTSQSPAHSLANVEIYVDNQVYPTNTDIVIKALTQVQDPVDFLWHFGDSKSVRSTSRAVTKRYQKPGRYDVIVVMSTSWTSVTSEVFPLVIQRVVKLNRLLHPPSALQNQTVTVRCWVSAGTDPSFLWSFGDGSSRMGQSTEQHTYYKTGEFIIEVTVFNQVSSASLSSPVFVVDQPCQPPPVKNMGPLKLQVHRYKDIHLGVTYEAALDCDISGGLHYTWTLFDSAGQSFPLPLIDTQKQSLVLPRNLLHYDTYTAIARVQVIGSVVYSNFTVRVQVVPSPPVAFIQGGTNIYINNRLTDEVTLDGQRSYDPDFPMNQVSFSWTCKPVSSISSSCFHHDIPMSFPVLSFPASLLKNNFDQFHFMLTVQNGERSAFSEAFVTLTPNLNRKVSVYCSQCVGDQVNWDQSFSVRAVSEGYDISSKDVKYSWSLFLVNESSKPVIEVPFCYTQDLVAPATILEDSATSTVHPPISETSQYTKAVNALETRAKNLNLTHSTVLYKNSRKNSNLTEAKHLSPVVRLETEGSGEEPFYRPQREFDPPEPLYSSTEYQTLTLDNSNARYPHHFGQSDFISELQIDSDSSANWEDYFPILENDDWSGQPDYDASILTPEEGDPGISEGRPTAPGEDGETFSPGDESEPMYEDEGNKLVDDRPSVSVQNPVLLDLPRDPVDRSVFDSYTYSGVSSPLLSFRPFSLRPGSRYMLEVSTNSPDSLLGRTQLFFKTSPAPKGMMCQVQPTTGAEFYTHFSIFCTSGREDLEYEYSFSVGGRPSRMLHQGRDFQYYFSLPSGDPHDDYKVTIYTVIRISTSGVATKPCPVKVQVLPSFSRDRSSSSHLDPDLVLSEEGLKNLSALVQLGNAKEIRNYISLLTSILNRLSLDSEANTQAQRHTRNALICTLCKLESSEEASMVDNIFILRNLLHVTHQVSFTSARRVMDYVRSILEKVLKSRAPGWWQLDKETLDHLVALLSYSLHAAGNSDKFFVTSVEFKIGDAKPALVSDCHGRKPLPNGWITDSSTDIYPQELETISTKQQKWLVAEILQTATELMLSYIMLYEVQELQASAGFIALHVRYQNETSAVITSGSSTIYLPSSLIQLLLVRSRDTLQPCVLSMLTELSYSPYTWAQHPGKISGPVIDLSLYKCNSTRRILLRPLIQPIIIQVQTQRNTSFVTEHILLHSCINYHSFNITQEHLYQVIQLNVMFMPLPSKGFPIMLLFRMFERPTPSMHHLLKIHHWDSNIARVTLPPSYLKEGVCHLALLNADFQKIDKLKYMSEHVRYSLTVESSLCLSWDDHQGAWTHLACKTQQREATTAVNCSCQQLRPVTVVREQIQSSHETADLDPFMSMPTDLTVLCVLVVCVCLYIPAIVMCKRADDISEADQGVHYLSDNALSDSYLYAVTVHTGPCSAAHMSAKVYIILNGEDGTTQTKELQVPGGNLFRRNSQNTFILSAADSLGPVWGVHIWHDNSGPSAEWYLKQVVVSEVNQENVKGPSWLFLGDCWLAVSKGDGRVERQLQVCNQAIGFFRMFSLKLSDYLADHHMWMSVHSCPSSSSFTRMQRLSISLLLLMGYACINAILISQVDDQPLLKVGIIDVSIVSMTTGLLSVVVVVPVGAMVSFLFRLHEVQMTGTEDQPITDKYTEKNCFEDDLSVTESLFQPHVLWSSLQQRAHEAWRTKHQGSSMIVKNKNTDQERTNQAYASTRKQPVNRGSCLQNSILMSEDNNVDQAPERKYLTILRDGREDNQKEKNAQGKKEDVGPCCVSWSSHSRSHFIFDSLRRRGFRPFSQWSHYLAWTVCLLLSLCCLVLSAVLGMRFSNSKVLLWLHSLFFSLMSCIFFIQTAVIFMVALAISFWYRNTANFQSFTKDETVLSKPWSCSGAHQTEGNFWKPDSSQRRCSDFGKLLEARQRTRYLHQIRPPTQAELSQSRRQKTRVTLISRTLRDLFICFFMLGLMLIINYGTLADYHQVNKVVRKQFTRGHDISFMSIQKNDDWWRWTQTSLLHLLYKKRSATAESHILIGEPILWKTGESRFIKGKVTLMPEFLHSIKSGSRTKTHKQPSVSVPMAASPRTCSGLSCYSGQRATITLGFRQSDAMSKLKLLRSEDWLTDTQMAAVIVQFTLFSPAPNLFTTVTMLAERSPVGVLLPSIKVHSARVYHTPTQWTYVASVCQLLLILTSVLQLYNQVIVMGQQDLMGYWRRPCNWLEASLVMVTCVYCIHYIYRSIIVLDVVELLQRQSHKGHTDVIHLATCEQNLCNLRGLLFFLLSTKFVTVLSVFRMFFTCTTLLTHTLPRILWPMITGFMLMVAVSFVGNPCFVKSSWALSLLPCSPLALSYHHWGPRALLFSRHDLLYRGALHLYSIVWTAVALGIVLSLVRRGKTSLTRGTVSNIMDLFKYVWQRVFPGYACKHSRTENQVSRRTYPLEEFESLLDELLLKLIVFSNSLHHTLPPIVPHYTEDSPYSSPIQEPSNTHSQETAGLITEESTANDHTEASSYVKTLPLDHLQRSHPELEVLTHLQQRSQRKDNPTPDIDAASENLQQPGTKTEENLKDSELQTHLRAPYSVDPLNPASLITSCLDKATHSKVVVEVLVHSAPENLLPYKK